MVGLQWSLGIFPCGLVLILGGRQVFPHWVTQHFLLLLFLPVSDWAWLCMPGWPQLSALLGLQVSSKTWQLNLYYWIKLQNTLGTRGRISGEGTGLSLALVSWPEAWGIRGAGKGCGLMGITTIWELNTWQKLVVNLKGERIVEVLRPRGNNCFSLLVNGQYWSCI